MSYLDELSDMPPLEWYPLTPYYGVLTPEYLLRMSRHLHFEISSSLEVNPIKGQPDDGEVSEALRAAVNLLDEAVENIMYAVGLMRYGTQSGTSVAPDSDDPQNAGSKPETGRKDTLRPSEAERKYRFG